MNPEDDYGKMARNCFGYGRWNAPFWFIGPEQGKGPKEEEGNHRRLDAWLRLGAPEVCDCACFHNLIGEQSWHRMNPRPQSTWKSLIDLLLTFRTGQPSTDDERRAYQRDHWGSKNGETCVIELSGLAARNLHAISDRNSCLQQRIETISRRIADNQPRLVILYGKGSRRSYEQIANTDSLTLEEPKRIGDIVYLFTKHPQAHGLTRSYWTELGHRLRRAF